MGLLPWSRIRLRLPDSTSFRATKPRNQVPPIQPGVSAEAGMRDQQANDGTVSITTIEQSQLDALGIGTSTVGDVGSDSDMELEVDQLIDDDD